jgi:Fur family ferric uptake transcriptional regulator
VPRLKIISIFESSKVRHLTAEDVYRKLLAEGPDIGLATVYRVLTQFEQAGLSSAITSTPGRRSRAERRASPRPSRLLRCGRVEEFYDAAIEKRQTRRSARARLRDFRPRALSLRRLREAALPLPQVEPQRRAAVAESRSRRRGTRIAFLRGALSAVTSRG